MVVLRKTFDFGKIDFFGTGRRTNPVEVDVQYRENHNGNMVFTASGTIYNRTKTDAYMCGQCLDNIAFYIHDPKFNEVYRLWQKYHLNDMHAGTVEQEEALKDCESRDYTERCKYLEERGLLTVEYNGKPYRYGTGWVYREIPKEDEDRIYRLLDSEKSELLNILRGI